MKLSHLTASLALAFPLMAGCHSDESLRPPLPAGGELFARYVAMGNSITAGYQSAGINDSTQRQSYAVLFANAAGTVFNIPSLQGRGCPPPLTNNVTLERVGGGSDSTCDLRDATPAPPPFINNVAVPGAEVQDLLTNFGTPVSSANALTTFILGGRTQIETMLDVDPTFVSLWIGNNDVLGAVTSETNPGDPALVTPLATFQAQYGKVLDRIEATGAEAALISVADIAVIPFTSTGSTYWCLKTGVCPGILPAPFPPNFMVDISCAPAVVNPASVGDSTRIPWTIGVQRIATAAGDPANTYTVDCTVDSEVITPSELANLAQAVSGYNAFISSEAAKRGWAYLDINPTLQSELGTRIPLFPDISASLTGGSVDFGPLFSLDGVHPSAEAHRIVADLLAAEVNQTFGSSIPVPVP